MRDSSTRSAKYAQLRLVVDANRKRAVYMGYSIWTDCEAGIWSAEIYWIEPVRHTVVHIRLHDVSSSPGQSIARAVDEIKHWNVRADGSVIRQ